MYPLQGTQMSLANQPAQQTGGLNWVDGEVGAKAYQMPANWPANQPIALWDTNDTIIYLKSINPMGMPNPLQKAHYTLEEYKSATPGQSGAEAPDMSQYVRKEDMERMKKELTEAINNVGMSGRHGRTEE
jgi:hypothetical protein